MRSRAKLSASSAPRAHAATAAAISLAHFEPGSGEIESHSNFLRVVGERPVAAGGDIGDNGADHGLDVGRDFTLGIEKSAKSFANRRRVCRGGWPLMMPCARCGDAYQVSFYYNNSNLTARGLSD